VRLDADGARRRFGGERRVVLGTAGADGVPHLVPVTFAARGDFVLTAVDDKPKRSTTLRRLRNIAANPAVCLLADVYDEDWSRLWWARADGTARVLERGAIPDGLLDLVDALERRYAHYAEHPPAGPFIVVEVAAWSGWSFSDADPRQTGG
jgi:PPOX class probable F420-dependent enzyme